MHAFRSDVRGTPIVSCRLARTLCALLCLASPVSAQESRPLADAAFAAEQPSASSAGAQRELPLPGNLAWTDSPEEMIAKLRAQPTVDRLTATLERPGEPAREFSLRDAPAVEQVRDWLAGARASQRGAACGLAGAGSADPGCPSITLRAGPIEMARMPLDLEARYVATGPSAAEVQPSPRDMPSPVLSRLALHREAALPLAERPALWRDSAGLREWFASTYREYGVRGESAPARSVLSAQNAAGERVELISRRSSLELTYVRTGPASAERERGAGAGGSEEAQPTPAAAPAGTEVELTFERSVAAWLKGSGKSELSTADAAQFMDFPDTGDEFARRKEMQNFADEVNRELRELERAGQFTLPITVWRGSYDFERGVLPVEQFAKPYLWTWTRPRAEDSLGLVAQSLVSGELTISADQGSRIGSVRRLPAVAHVQLAGAIAPPEFKAFDELRERIGDRRATVRRPGRALALRVLAVDVYAPDTTGKSDRGALLARLDPPRGKQPVAPRGNGDAPQVDAAPGDAAPDVAAERSLQEDGPESTAAKLGPLLRGELALAAAARLSPAFFETEGRPTIDPNLGNLLDQYLEKRRGDAFTAERANEFELRGLRAQAAREILALAERFEPDTEFVEQGRLLVSQYDFARQQFVLREGSGDAVILNRLQIRDSDSPASSSSVLLDGVGSLLGRQESRLGNLQGEIVAPVPEVEAQRVVAELPANRRVPVVIHYRLTGLTGVGALAFTGRIRSADVYADEARTVLLAHFPLSAERGAEAAKQALRPAAGEAPPQVATDSFSGAVVDAAAVRLGGTTFVTAVASARIGRPEFDRERLLRDEIERIRSAAPAFDPRTEFVYPFDTYLSRYDTERGRFLAPLPARRWATRGESLLTDGYLLGSNFDALLGAQRCAESGCGGETLVLSMSAEQAKDLLASAGLDERRTLHGLARFRVVKMRPGALEFEARLSSIEVYADAEHTRRIAAVPESRKSAPQLDPVPDEESFPAAGAGSERPGSAPSRAPARSPSAMDLRRLAAREIANGHACAAVDILQGCAADAKCENMLRDASERCGR